MSSIKSNKPSGKSKYRQGYYKLINPEKYIGDPSKIIYRSSWEYKFCKYCDLSEKIEKWSSEPVGIKYVSPIDGKEHTYFVDFYMRVTEKDRSMDYLAEVKPSASLAKPVLEGKKMTTNKIKNYNYALQTWIINRAKFASAKHFAEGRGYKFIVVTEEILNKI
jgi:hypothetical protein